MSYPTKENTEKMRAAKRKARQERVAAAKERTERRQRDQQALEHLAVSVALQRMEGREPSSKACEACGSPDCWLGSLQLFVMAAVLADKRTPFYGRQRLPRTPFPRDNIPERGNRAWYPLPGRLAALAGYLFQGEFRKGEWSSFTPAVEDGYAEWRARRATAAVEGFAR